MQSQGRRIPVPDSFSLYSNSVASPVIFDDYLVLRRRDLYCDVKLELQMSRPNTRNKNKRQRAEDSENLSSEILRYSSFRLILANYLVTN